MDVIISIADQPIGVIKNSLRLLSIENSYHTQTFPHKLYDFNNLGSVLQDMCGWVGVEYVPYVASFASDVDAINDLLVKLRDKHEIDQVMLWNPGENIRGTRWIERLFKVAREARLDGVEWMAASYPSLAKGRLIEREVAGKKILRAPSFEPFFTSVLDHSLLVATGGVRKDQGKGIKESMFARLRGNKFLAFDPDIVDPRLED